VDAILREGHRLERIVLVPDAPLAAEERDLRPCPEVEVDPGEPA
jgi:hypothetical protein